jgi:hypothetical protein
VTADLDMLALEAVRPVAAEYGIGTADLKPCVALVLDGNIGGSARHECAFVIAMELRRLGWPPAKIEAALTRWARKIGYSEHEARRAIRGAFGPRGYYPPGLTKRLGTSYERVLAPTCAHVGCPQNCPPFRGRVRSVRREGVETFRRLGWPAVLRRRRQNAALATYEAICSLELLNGVQRNEPLLTSYRQLARMIETPHWSTARRGLVTLDRHGLLTYKPGKARTPADPSREPSRIWRIAPGRKRESRGRAPGARSGRPSATGLLVRPRPARFGVASFDRDDSLGRQARRATGDELLDVT